MPFTASKTAPDANATTRVVTSGFVPAAITVSFMIAFHCSTGSGDAAFAGTELAIQSTPSRTANPVRGHFCRTLTKIVGEVLSELSLLFIACLLLDDH